MRAKLFLAFELLAVTAGVAHAVRPVPMVNPSFEEERATPEGPAAPDWERRGGVPGWHVWIGSVARTGKPKITWLLTGGHTGRRAVSLTGCIGGVCVIQSVPVRTDRSYEARVWMKTSSPQRRCGLTIRFQTAARKWATGTQRAFLPANALPNQWAEMRVTFTPPKDAGFAVFLLTADGQKPGDACWFDDASLTALDPGELAIADCGWIHPNCLPVGKPAETPHVPWGKPWAGRRLNVLFLTGSDHNLREPIELAQRLDIDYDYAFAHQFEPTVFALNDREVADRLRSKAYDVIVVGVSCPALMLTKFSECARGLVLIRCPRIRPKLPAEAKLALAGEASPPTEAIDALPPIGDIPAGGVAGVRVGRLGQARVVQVEYKRGSNCLTPNVAFDEHLNMGGEYWEAYMQILARAILYAGDSPAPVQADLIANGGTAALRLSAAAPRNVTVFVRFCDKVGRSYEQSFGVGLNPGSQQRIEPPKHHPAGPSTVLVTVRDARGRSLGFAAARLIVERPARISAVVPDRPHYEREHPVGVEVHAAGDIGATRAEAALTDAFGRTHARAVSPITSGRARLALSHARKLSTFNWLTVRLLRGDAELDASRTYILAPLAREEFLSDYQVGTWASSSYMSAYTHPTLHRLMREAGITLGIQHASVYPSMLADRMMLISTAYGRIPGYTRHTSTEHVRKQCLNDPAIRTKMATAARDIAGGELGVRPIFGYIRDETSLVRDHLAVDVCASAHCVARFREWLRGRYGNIEHINRHWHTSYRSWDDIGFTSYDQVRGKDTFAPWVMFRRFQEWSWAEGIKSVNRSAREADPTALLALPNTFGQKPFVGRDYWLLAQVNAYTMEYPTETRSQLESRAVFDTLRCFNPATRHHPWMGYRFDDAVIRFVPWWTACHGASGAAVYGTMSFFAGKNSWAQIFPSLQHTKRGLLYAKEFEELKRGIGKLLMHARRPAPDVAILWSQAAMHIGWAFSDQTTNPGSLAKRNAYSQHFASRRAFRLALLESWRQFDYVCEEQIRQGSLDRHKWLLMPAAYGVDEDVAAAIEKFVQNGGTVVADMGAGLTNEAGARLKGATPLTRLFGFRRTGGDLDHVERQASDTAPAETVGGAIAPFSAVGRETATALPGTTTSSYEDGPPLFIARRHGRGRTLLMNCRAPDSPALVPLFDRLPRLAHLAFAKAKDRPAGYELVRFETGANALLAILRDWRAAGPDESIVVTLPAAAHVYDVRAGEYMGHTKRFECQLALGDARLYALMPYRVERIEVIAPRQSAPGRMLKFTCAIRDPARVGDHVLRIDVLRPDGKLSEAYGLNLVAREGRAQGHIPFALNDPVGRWTVVARDVASGVEAERAVIVAAD